VWQEVTTHKNHTGDIGKAIEQMLMLAQALGEEIKNGS
jgi:hypothetical protein